MQIGVAKFCWPRHIEEAARNEKESPFSARFKERHQPGDGNGTVTTERKKKKEHSSICKDKKQARIIMSNGTARGGHNT